MEKEKEISEQKKKNDTQADCVNILIKIQRFLQATSTKLKKVAIR